MLHWIRILYMHLCLFACCIVAFAQQSQPKGWTHPRNDLAGSNYHIGSTKRSGLPEFTWSYSLPTSTSQYVLSADVTGDQQLEVITVQSDTLFIFSANGQLLSRTDVRIAAQNRRAHVVMLEDINGDGKAEIGIGYQHPWVNYGQWKCRIYDGTGIMLKEFTKAGSHDGGMYPRTVIGQDIIISQHADYSADIRGFSRWSYNSATELWQYDVGPHSSDLSFADINNDGLLEMSWGSFTAHNGSTGHSTSDDNCYTIIMNENGSNVLTQLYPIAERTGVLSDMLVRFSPNDPYRILSLKHYDPTYYRGTSRIHIRRTDGTILRTRTGLPNTSWTFGWADLDGDGIQDIICSNNAGSTNRLYVLDTLLAVKDSLITSTGLTVQAICDINGDGVPEILVSAGGSATVIVFDNHLREQWRWTDSLSSSIAKVITSDNNLDGAIDVVVLTNRRVVSLAPKQVHSNQEDPDIYAYPNPFNPETQTVTFRIVSAKDARASIAVLDISGARVYGVVNVLTLAAGTPRTVPWDGRVEKNRNMVANGTYFYVVEFSSGERFVGKIAALR